MTAEAKKKERFGDRAVRMGLVKKEQVRRALVIQKNLARAGEPQRGLGRILVDIGALTNEQYVKILLSY